jgi:hypothetical protein
MFGRGAIAAITVRVTGASPARARHLGHRMPPGIPDRIAASGARFTFPHVSQRLRTHESSPIDRRLTPDRGRRESIACVYKFSI